MRFDVKNRIQPVLTRSLQKGPFTEDHWLLSDVMLPQIARAFFLLNFKHPRILKAFQEIPLPLETTPNEFPTVGGVISSCIRPVDNLYFLAASFEQHAIPHSKSWQIYFKDVLNHPFLNACIQQSLILTEPVVLPKVVTSFLEIDAHPKPFRAMSIRVKD